MISSRQRKYALVTGASSGIGREYAAQLAAKGYDLVMAGNRDEENRAAAREIAARYGVRTLPLCMDLSEPDAAVKLHAETSARGIEIGVLVCNAGIAQVKLFTDTTDEDWRRMMAVDLDGAFYACRAVLPGMIRRQSGCIITTSSIWGITGASCEVPYSAAKAGIIGLTRALAKEVGPSGIRVNCIAPGVIDTEMNGNLTPEVMAQLREETPLGTIGTPKQVADLALYLAGEGASFLTGQVISPNGGFLI